jgi:glycosyltransferase involved in cell wall biosynthesis
MQHKPVAERMIQFYPEIDKIYSIHSEVIELEDPIKHESIKKYIAIRPEIKEHLINKFNIESDKIEVVYNPVDENKFYNKNIKSENYILFVGSIDYLRESTIRDLINVSKEENKELWIVGENKSNYLQEILQNSHVKYFPPTLDVDKYIHKCSETAGILLGRTTIEGWMCGKPGWIYNVDENGFILYKDLYQVPLDVDKYFSSNSSKIIKENYINVMNS